MFSMHAGGIPRGRAIFLKAFFLKAPFLFPMGRGKGAFVENFLKKEWYNKNIICQKRIRQRGEIFAGLATHGKACRTFLCCWCFVGEGFFRQSGKFTGNKKEEPG